MSALAGLGMLAQCVRLIDKGADLRHADEVADIARGASAESDAARAGRARWQKDISRRIDRASDISKTSDLKELPQEWKPLDGEVAQLVARVEKIQVDSRPVRRVRVVAVIPETPKAFSNVYGHPHLSVTIAKDMRKVSSEFEKLENVSLLKNEMGSRGDVFKAIEAADDAELTIFVTHSSEGAAGRSLHLPDKTKIDARDLHVYADERNKSCLVVTCHSDDLMIDTDVTMREALNLCRRATENAEASEAETVATLALKMRQELVAGRIRRVALKASVPVVAGGLIVRLSIQGITSHPRRRS